MDGELFDLDQEMESHVNCRCTPVPVTKGWDEILGPLGIDTSSMDDSSVTDDFQSGSDWLDSQDESVQQSVLGNTGYDAWKNNDDVTLMDFVGRSSNPEWGDSIYQRSVKQILARK
jgi:hypothetical protein